MSEVRWWILSSLCRYLNINFSNWFWGFFTFSLGFRAADLRHNLEENQTSCWPLTSFWAWELAKEKGSWGSSVMHTCLCYLHPETSFSCTPPTVLLQSHGLWNHIQVGPTAVQSKWDCSCFLSSYSNTQNWWQIINKESLRNGFREAKGGWMRWEKTHSGWQSKTKHFVIYTVINASIECIYFFPNMALHVAVPDILRHSFYLKTRQSLATAKSKFISWRKPYSNVLIIFTTSIWTGFGWYEDLLKSPVKQVLKSWCLERYIEPGSLGI